MVLAASISILSALSSLLRGLLQADDAFRDSMKEEGRGLRPVCDVLGCEAGDSPLFSFGTDRLLPASHRKNIFMEIVDLK
jgi:hypothetical protein